MRQKADLPSVCHRARRLFIALVAAAVATSLFAPAQAFGASKKITLSPTWLSVTEGSTYSSYVITTSANPGTTGITITATPVGDLELTLDNPTTPGAVWHAAPIAVNLNSRNYSSGVRVYARALDDLSAQPSPHTATVTHSPVGGWSYRGGSTVSVSITDNDTPAVLVSPTSLSLPEGGSGSYSLSLNGAPTASVTIAVTSSDPTWASPSPASVTFTTSNWSTPRTVTVSAGNDYIDGPDHGPYTLSHAVSSSDTRYSEIAVPSVSATVTDNDTAGVTVSRTAASALEGATAAYTVVLNAQPTADVSIAVSPSDPSWASPSPSPLTFTSGNWATPQTVTVTAGNDDIAGSDHVVTISHAVTSSDAKYNAIAAPSVRFTAVDEDRAGVYVSETDLSAAEGGTDTYTVVLRSEPVGDVTITASSADPTWATPSPASLLFTGENWATPQTVTVTAGGDDVDGPDHGPIVISHSAASSDLNYDGFAVDSVSFTATDDDTAGVVVSETAIGATEGGTDTYTVVLASEPTTGVTITVTSADPTWATPSPASLLFTAENWATPQTVTVAAGHDDIDGPDHGPIAVSHSATSEDPGYNAVSIASIDFTATDDDTAGVVVSKAATTAPEDGTDTYTVVLTSEPTADVAITVSSADPDWASPSPASLVFAAENWATPQTVTVTAGNDNVDGPDHGPILLSHEATSADGNYGGILIGSVDFTVTDDDTASVVVSETAIGAAEGGTGTYAVVLTSEPTADVAITVTSADPDWASPSPVTLIFTAGDWDEPQTVTVTAGDDDVDGPDHGPIVISHSAASEDPNYAGIFVASVDFTVTDDDSFGAGVSPTSLLISESEAGSYEIVLRSAPTATVTITVTSSSPAWVVPSPAVLTFTPGDWSMPQVVTVTASDDKVVAGNHTATLTHAAASADVNYNGLAMASVLVCVADNDLNLPPRSLTATVLDSGGTAGVHLAWKAPLTRTGQPTPIAYRIYVGTSAKTATKFVKEVTGLTADVTQDDFARSDPFRLEAGRKYYFTVRAIYDTGETTVSKPSNVASAAAGPVLPREPRSLKAYVVSRGIRLLWQLPTGEVPEGYLVYDAATLTVDPSAQPLAVVTEWEGSQPNFDITGLTLGRKYTFKIYSFVTHPLTGEMVRSAKPASAGAVASALTVLKPPANLQAKPGDAGVLVSWKQPAGGLPDVYRIEVLEPTSGAWLPTTDVPWLGPAQAYQVTASQLEAAGGAGFYQANSVKYTFRVFGVGDPGGPAEVLSSAAQAAAVAGPIPSPPTSLTVRQPSRTTAGLLLTWKAPKTGTPAGYFIEVSVTSNADGFVTIRDGLTSLSYLVTESDFTSGAPSAGATVYFRVGAYWYDPLEGSRASRIVASGYAVANGRWPAI